MRQTKRHFWWGWPRGYVPGESWSKGVGKGKLRRHLVVSLEVEFHLAFSPEHAAWLVKVNRARGPFQFLPFHAVPRPVRDQLRAHIETVAGRRTPRLRVVSRQRGITTVRKRS